MDALSQRLARENQSALSRTLGVNVKTVHRWTHGRFSPDAAILPKLADALGMDLADLASIVAERSKQNDERRTAEAVA